jgi:hypothetical protein
MMLWKLDTAALRLHTRTCVCERLLACAAALRRCTSQRVCVNAQQP